MKLYRTGLSIAIGTFGFCALSFSANVQQNTSGDWLQEDVSSITSVRAYCAYLDRFIPSSFQNYRGFMRQLKLTSGQENLKIAEMAEKWDETLKANANTWGALGCAQLIYGTQQGKPR